MLHWIVFASNWVENSDMTANISLKSASNSKNYTFKSLADEDGHGWSSIWDIKKGIKFLFSISMEKKNLDNIDLSRFSVLYSCKYMYHKSLIVVPGRQDQILRGRAMNKNIKM